MKFVLVAVGQTRDPYREPEAHYLKMLRRHLSVEIDTVKDDQALIRRLSQRRGWVVALDERGRSRDSVTWASWLDERRVAALDVYLLVGGQTGLPQQALEAANEKVSFGPQTIAHQLARIVLLEQLFRAAKISAGEPYHC